MKLEGWKWEKTLGYEKKNKYHRYQFPHKTLRILWNTLIFLVVYYRKSRDSIIASPHMFIKYFDDIHNHIFSPPPCYNMCACLVCMWGVQKSQKSSVILQRTLWDRISSWTWTTPSTSKHILHFCLNFEFSWIQAVTNSFPYVFWDWTHVNEVLQKESLLPLNHLSIIWLHLLYPYWSPFQLYASFLIILPISYKTSGIYLCKIKSFHLTWFFLCPSFHTKLFFQNMT